MYRRLPFCLCILLAGCFPVRREFNPYALPGTEIRVVQSKYQELDATPEYYTAARDLKIDITIADTKPQVLKTVLWYRQSTDDPWYRGPESAPGDRWIQFRPIEGRHYCRGSVVYADGTEAFKPNRAARACFCLVVDQTPPQIVLAHPGSVHALTAPDLEFQIWDGGLGPQPTAELWFSADAGASWERLGVLSVRGGANKTGWDVPVRPGSRCMLKLICRDLAGNESFAETDKTFTILPPITMLKAGERFILGAEEADKPPPAPEPTTPPEPEPPAPEPAEPEPAAPELPVPAPSQAAAPQPTTEPPPPATTPDAMPLEPEIAQPAIVQPEPAAPEIAQPEPAQPEPAAPEIAQPAVVQPEPAQPEPAQPEPATPEIAQPAIVQPEPAQPEIAQPEPAAEPPLAVRTTGTVRAGAQLNVQVENLPALTWQVALLWRPTSADAWTKTDAHLQRDFFAWTSPAGDTQQGQLRVEVMGTGGSLIASAETGPVIVDGTPPVIQIETMAAPDPRQCAVRAASQDAGAGVEWVNLFITRDGGQSWTSGAVKMDSAVDMSLPRQEQAIGFFAQAQDKVGNRSAAPRTGTPPQLVVGPRPALGIVLNELTHHVVKGGERALLTWSITGEYADDCAATLQMQRDAGGPWERVDAVGLALKHADWDAPAETVPSVSLRVLVSFPGGTTLASNTIGPYAVVAEPPTLVIGGGEFFASHMAAIPVAEMQTGPAELARVIMYVRPEGRHDWTPREARYAAGVVTMNTADLAEQTYDLYAAAEDLCGNAVPAPQATAEPHATLTVNRTPPRAKLKLNPPYYEGIAGALDVALSAPARVFITVREDGGVSEHAVLERDLQSGSTTLPFRPAPGFRSGTLSLKAQDKAGNRAESAAYFVNAGETLKFESPVDQAQLAPGAAVPVKWWIRQALLDERPVIDLWWLPGPGAVRESIARDLPPERPFSWLVPDRPGPGQSLRIEARVGDVVRACAAMSATFAIASPHSALAPAAVKAPSVNPDSDEFALAGHVCLDDLEKALAAKNMEKVNNFRLHAGNRFRQALGLDAGNANAWWGMARMCTAPISEVEELDKAEEYLAKAVAANPRHYEALVFLGACRIKLHKHQEAENSLTLALNLRDSPIVRYNLGIALLRQRKHALALAEFQRAVQGPAPIRAAYLAIVECHVAQKEFVKARDAYVEALAKGAVPDERRQRILDLIDDGLKTQP